MSIVASRSRRCLDSDSTEWLHDIMVIGEIVFIINLQSKLWYYQDYLYEQIASQGYEAHLHAKKWKGLNFVKPE